MTPDLFAANGTTDRRPHVAALLPRLLAALDRRGWVSASVLSRELCTDPRSLREGAHQSAGRILGHQRGYILTTQATIEEVQRVTRRLLSQAGHMKGRVLEIERVRHAGVRDE